MTKLTLRKLTRLGPIAVIAGWMLAAPATGLATNPTVKPEPGGAPAPASLIGRDHYGPIRVTLVLPDNGNPLQVIQLDYANACSAAGTSLSPNASVGASGLFAWSNGTYAVSGRIIVTGGRATPTYTLRGSVVSSHVCHGATGPVLLLAHGTD